MNYKWLFVDGNNLLCRAHFSSNLTDKKQRPTGGTFGVMRMTRNIIKKFDPEKVVIAWDEGKSEERIRLYPDYKANRINRDPQMKKDISRQMLECRKLFGQLPIRQVWVEGVEADDIIGVLCDKLKGKKIVLTNDQDMIQLVNKDVSLWLPKQEKLLTAKTVEGFLGFPVRDYVLWKSMVGDSSDNIKGIKGIGPKRATEIILKAPKMKKKPKVSAEEMAILDRNAHLITIGAVLTEKQMGAIKKFFVTEAKKKVSFQPVRIGFTKMGFKSLVRGFDDWSRCFNKIKKNEGGMQWQKNQ